MRQFATTLSLVALLQGFPAVVQAQTQPASELPTDPIEQVVTAKLMGNYPDGQFYPERILSRGELASILVKTFRLDTRAAAKQDKLVPVGDVPQSHPAFNDIQVVLKTGIMRGYRDNMFFPNQRVNRAEALAIFAQAYGVFQFPDDTVGKILAKYPDSGTIPSWARKSMATALYEGFANTDEQGNILPQNPMTRGDMAYALSKYLERQETTAPVLDDDIPFPASSQFQ